MDESRPLVSKAYGEAEAHAPPEGQRKRSRAQLGGACVAAVCGLAGAYMALTGRSGGAGSAGDAATATTLAADPAEMVDVNVPLQSVASSSTSTAFSGSTFSKGEGGRFAWPCRCPTAAHLPSPTPPSAALSQRTGTDWPKEANGRNITVVEVDTGVEVAEANPYLWGANTPMYIPEVSSDRPRAT